VADLCGVGVQDASIAAEVMRRAAGAGIGRTIEL
jgi:ornithine cyclodeaminase/alanine dehydrogenase-like protein (mu-crystallin family)